MKLHSCTSNFHLGNNDPQFQNFTTKYHSGSRNKRDGLNVLMRIATVISILKDEALKTVAKIYLTLPVTVNMLAKLINLTHKTNL